MRPRRLGAARAWSCDVGPARQGVEPWLALALLVVAGLVSSRIHAQADALEADIAVQARDHAQLLEFRHALRHSRSRAPAAPTAELPSGRILTVAVHRACAALVQMSPSEPPR